VFEARSPSPETRRYARPELTTIQLLMNSILLRGASAIGFAVLLASCNDAVTEPPPVIEGTFTVDASTGWVYVSLADSATVVPTPSARESSAWDIGFSTTSVTLNGGEAGPGGVTGACVCQNAGATNAEILAMTPEAEKPDFDAVTSVPAGATFVEDELTPAITSWYSGSGATASADESKVFLVRLADGSSFAKVRVAAIQNASAGNPGAVTLEYAVQSSASAAFGQTRTITVDATSASQTSVDLNADAFSTEAGEWDIRLVGWNLLVNGGVSGPGAAGVATGSGSFESITTASTTPQAYRIDVYAGVFGTHQWYKYNLANDNRISPTFDVYLVKRGTTVYKLQITNYYNASAQPRHITFRYRRIAQ
jgi:hypothetical protein